MPTTKRFTLVRTAIAPSTRMTIKKPKVPSSETSGDNFEKLLEKGESAFAGTIQTEVLTAHPSRSAPNSNPRERVKISKPIQTANQSSLIPCCAAGAASLDGSNLGLCIALAMCPPFYRTDVLQECGILTTRSTGAQYNECLCSQTREDTLNNLNKQRPWLEIGLYRFRIVA